MNLAAVDSDQPNCGCRRRRRRVGVSRVRRDIGRARPRRRSRHRAGDGVGDCARVRAGQRRTCGGGRGERCLLGARARCRTRDRAGRVVGGRRGAGDGDDGGRCFDRARHADVAWGVVVAFALRGGG